MKVYLGSDHAGVELRGKLAARLRSQGHEAIDLGPQKGEPADYPDWSARVGRSVRDDAGSVGVLVCGSGIGVCMAANKVHGVRAAAPWSVEAARLARSHNDANVLCLGSRLIPESESEAMLDAWLTSSFEGERHLRRVQKMSALERSEAAQVAMESEIAALEARNVAGRIWARDPRAFTADTSHDKSILNRLGWLRSPEEMQPKIAELKAFAADVVRDGFRHVVLLGMGGSSLCPEVFAHTFGSSTGLSLTVLDSTDPQAVGRVEASIDLQRTLFVVSSKSGGTIEVRSFERYFWHRLLETNGGDRKKAGSQFIAITDPSTLLEGLALENGYRAIFRNPPDIGGRYSALSYFGLVPAALLGMDVAKLLARAAAMAKACQATVVAKNPGAELGARLGALAKAGRNKLTLVLSPELASMGSWIEQLVAESTGKLGKGILPVDGEPLAAPELYGPDRVFVVMHLADGAPAATAAQLDALRAAGHPVIEWTLADRYDLGGDLFRWEIATAVAGASLEINPFDEPNVTEAKQATGKLLDAFAVEGKLPAASPVVTPDDAAAIWAHVDSAVAGDYLALCAYFDGTAARQALLTQVRVACQARRHVATTIGYGPRFLHSTGQLHKGGANNGVFLQLVADVAQDLPVPGDPFSFGVLRDAQALGDFQVLQARGRRALRINLGSDVDAGLKRLATALAGPAPAKGKTS